MGIIKRKITFFLFVKLAANNYMTGNIFKFNKIALSLQWKKTLEYTRKRQYIYDFISLSYIITHGLVTGCLVCIKIVHVYRACSTQIVYHFITSLGVKLNIYHNHEILQLFSTFFFKDKRLIYGEDNTTVSLHADWFIFVHWYSLCWLVLTLLPSLIVFFHKMSDWSNNRHI